VRTERLVVAQDLSLAEPKTKLLVEKLKTLSVDNVLIIVEAQDDKLFLAARNLPFVDVLTAASINPLALAAHDKVLITVGAVKMLEERLQ
jgi:large subunit ribosomal protein L4